MLGSVAEAARLVAPRNILVVDNQPDVETAVPASTAATAAAGADGTARVAEKVARGKSAGSGGGGGLRGAGEVGAAAVASSREQVPLFRFVRENISNCTPYLFFGVVVVVVVVIVVAVVAPVLALTNRLPRPQDRLQ